MSSLLQKSVKGVNHFARTMMTSPRNCESLKTTSAAAAQTLRKLTPELSNYEKTLLIWSGKFKRYADIPNTVPVEVLDRAYSRARIRICNLTMVFGAVGCMVYAFMGKNAAHRGESLGQMNLEWHQQYNAAHQDDKPKEG